MSKQRPETISLLGESFPKTGKINPKTRAAFQHLRSLYQSRLEPDEAAPRIEMARYLYAASKRSSPEIYYALFSISLCLVLPRKPKHLGSRSNARGYRDSTRAFLRESNRRIMLLVPVTKDAASWLPRRFHMSLQQAHASITDAIIAFDEAVSEWNYAEDAPRCVNTLRSELGVNRTKHVVLSLETDLRGLGYNVRSEATRLWLAASKVRSRKKKAPKTRTPA
jgi:hypothetical protein